MFFKMLPLHQRDGYRFIAQSIAASAGVLIGSGLSMLHSEAGVGLFTQAVVGIGLTCGGVNAALQVVGRHLRVAENLDLGDQGLREHAPLAEGDPGADAGPRKGTGKRICCQHPLHIFE